MRLRGRMPQSSAVEERVAALNQFLFETSVSTAIPEYYDPCNSYLTT